MLKNYKENAFANEIVQLKCALHISTQIVAVKDPHWHDCGIKENNDRTRNNFTTTRSAQTSRMIDEKHSEPHE
jgi:hypothetical protein